MNKLFINTKQEPQIFYCKHIAPGVCGYNDETIFIGEDTLKKMDKTFAGKPLYVDHQQVDLEHLQEQADGYVIESFYLPEDGNHWAKIIVVSDKGHEAVSKGWAVSNAYIPDNFGGKGEWHNIPYDREITEGHYTHLAIVQNPRYEEAVIMTPEEFKQYKAGKKEQLNQLQNSKQGAKEQMSMFKLFTKKEVTNSEDISNAMVELSNGTTVSIKEMINACEEDIKAKEAAKNKKNEDEEILEKVVKVNGEDVKVKDLIKSYEAKKNKCNEDEEEEDEEKKSKKNKANEDKDEDKKEEKKDKKNESDEEKKDKKNEEDEEDKEKSDKKNEDEEKKEKESKKNSKDFADILKKAEELANAKESNSIVADTMSIKLARGTERYGSK